MGITLTADGQPVEIKRFNFSGGEVQVRLLDPPATPTRWHILAHVHSSDDLMALLLITDAARRIADAPVHLEIPYLPYARQDRAAWTGEAFSLDVLARLIATGGYASVTSWDVHSKVSTERIAGLVSIPARDFIRPHLAPGERVVAPDAGAVARAGLCADEAHPLVRAVKRRDPDTGDVKDPQLLDDVGAHDRLIVVDDICDGGRTFTHLGRFLRGITDAPLRLYVTHGIFSHGIDELRAIFDEILTANLFDPALADHVTVVARQD